MTEAVKKLNDALDQIEAFCDDYTQHDQRQVKRILELTAQRDVLLEVVKRFRQWDALDIPDTDGAFWKREIDAAIKRVEENT